MAESVVGVSCAVGACAGARCEDVHRRSFHGALVKLTALRSCHIPGNRFPWKRSALFGSSGFICVFSAFISTQVGILARNMNMAALLPEVRGLQSDEVQ